jgi:tetratricopeptide (TPR) repeat protein
MNFRRTALLATLAVTLSSHALAETKSSASPQGGATENGAPENGVKKDAESKDYVRRDPKGIKGVRPLVELMRRGDDAAVARDYEKAKTTYQEALTMVPKTAILYFRIGQVETMAGKLSEAETAYTDALRYADNDPTLYAQLLFVLADLKERQLQRDAALKAWQAYADFLKSEPKAKGYLATAEERQKRLLRYNELVVESKGVKDRVTLRLKEIEENVKNKAK